MYDVCEAELLSACRMLFGPDVQVNQDFLGYLQAEGAKVAYRKRARESHPDAHPRASQELRRQLHDSFTRLSHAYQTLQVYLTARNMGRTVRASSKPGVSKPHPPRQQADELYYQGPVPWIELKLGRYLYFRGLVSYQEILRALRWQWEQRPCIGVLARQRGWLDDRTVHGILQDGQIRGRFGERALQLGLLTGGQVQELLAIQQRQQKRLGRYFIEQGLFQETDVSSLDSERMAHNRAVIRSHKAACDT